jgi:hypothetical protein
VATDDDKAAAFLIESVVAVIEVKTELNAREVQSATKHAAKFSRLYPRECFDDRMRLLQLGMRVADADEMVLDTPFALDVGRNAQLGLPRKYVVGYSGYQASSLDSLMAAATQDLSVPVEWNDEVEFFRSLPDLVVGRECVVYKNVRPWQIQPVEWMLLGATVDEPLALFAAHLLHTIASSVALPPDVYGRGLNYAAYGELLGVPTPSAVGLRAHSQFPQPHLLGMPARIDECAIVSDATRTYVRAPVRVPTGAFAAELPLAVAKHWPNTILVDCEPNDR